MEARTRSRGGGESRSSSSPSPSSSPVAGGYASTQASPRAKKNSSKGKGKKKKKRDKDKNMAKDNLPRWSSQTAAMTNGARHSKKSTNSSDSTNSNSTSQSSSSCIWEMDELVLHVFSFLTLRDLCAIASVSKRFSDLSSENCLWKTFCYRDVMSSVDPHAPLIAVALINSSSSSASLSSSSPSLTRSCPIPLIHQHSTRSPHTAASSSDSSSNSMCHLCPWCSTSTSEPGSVDSNTTNPISNSVALDVSAMHCTCHNLRLSRLFLLRGCDDLGGSWKSVYRHKIFLSRKLVRNVIHECESASPISPNPSRRFDVALHQFLTLLLTPAFIVASTLAQVIGPKSSEKVARALVMLAQATGRRCAAEELLTCLISLHISAKKRRRTVHTPPMLRKSANDGASGGSDGVSSYLASSNSGSGSESPSLRASTEDVSSAEPKKEKVTQLRLLPSNDVLSKMITIYFHSIGSDYLYETFSPPIEEMIRRRGFLRSKSRNRGEKFPPDLDARKKAVNEDAQFFLNAIVANAPHCPLTIRRVCRYLRDEVRTQLADDVEESEWYYVHLVLFYRFFLPSLVTPSYGLVSRSIANVSKDTARSTYIHLVSVAKALHVLSYSQNYVDVFEEVRDREQRGDDVERSTSSVSMSTSTSTVSVSSASSRSATSESNDSSGGDDTSDEEVEEGQTKNVTTQKERTAPASPKSKKKDKGKEKDKENREKEKERLGGPGLLEIHFREANQGKLEELFEAIVDVPEEPVEEKKAEVDWHELSAALTNLLEIVTGENRKAFLHLLSREVSIQFMEHMAGILDTLGEHVGSSNPQKEDSPRGERRRPTRKESCLAS